MGWHFNGSRGGAKPNLYFQMDISGMMRYYSIDFGDLNPVGPRSITRWGPRYARRWFRQVIPRPGQGLLPIAEGSCAATYASSEGNNRYRDGAATSSPVPRDRGPMGIRVQTMSFYGCT